MAGLTLNIHFLRVSARFLVPGAPVLEDATTCCCVSGSSSSSSSGSSSGGLDGSTSSEASDDVEALLLAGYELGDDGGPEEAFGDLDASSGFAAHDSGWVENAETSTRQIKLTFASGGDAQAFVKSFVATFAKAS